MIFKAHLIAIFFFLFSSAVSFAGSEDSLNTRILKQYDRLQAFNLANTKAGHTEKNIYIIGADKFTLDYIDKKYLIGSTPGANEGYDIAGPDDFEKININLSAFNDNNNVAKIYICLAGVFSFDFKTSDVSFLFADMTMEERKQKVKSLGSDPALMNKWQKQDADLNAKLKQKISSSSGKPYNILYYHRRNMYPVLGKKATQPGWQTYLNVFSGQTAAPNPDIPTFRNRLKNYKANRKLKGDKVDLDNINDIDLKDVDYVNNYISLIADFCNSGAYKDANYNMDPVSGCAGNVPSLSSANKAQYDKDVSAASGLIDYSSQTKFIFSDPSKPFGWMDVNNQFLKDRIEDKLAALATNSSYKLVIVAKEVSYSLTTDQGDDFAKAVYQAKNPGGNTILITLPYYTDNCIITSVSNGNRTSTNQNIGVPQPGVYTTDNALLASLKTALHPGSGEKITEGTKLFDYVVNAYKNIPKNHYLYAYSLIWNGDYIKTTPSLTKNITGFENIHDVLIENDGRYEQIKGVQTQISTWLSNQAISNIGSIGNAGSADKLSAYQSYINQMDGIWPHEDLIKTILISSLKQTGFDETKADKYAFWIWLKKTGKGNPIQNAPDNGWFYGNQNPEAAKDFLAIIDNAGIVASMVGLDVIFDTWGFYYAMDNHLEEDAIIYTASIATVVASAGEIKLVLNGIRKGKMILVRQLYNNKLVVKSLLGNGKLYSSFVPIIANLKLEKVISQNLSSQISNEKSFFKLLSHKNEADGIKKLEEAFENNSVKDLINSDPNKVDDFFDYYKKNPNGTVDEFLSGFGSLWKRFDVAGEFAKGLSIVTTSFVNKNGTTVNLVWKKVGNRIEFGARLDIRSTLGLASGTGTEAHHIITWTKGGSHDVIQIAALDGFHPNMLENAVELEKYFEGIGGVHGNHPAYDAFMGFRLDRFQQANPGLTPQVANEFLQKN